jgi:hypothetical protein
METQMQDLQMIFLHDVNLYLENSLNSKVYVIGKVQNCTDAQILNGMPQNGRESMKDLLIHLLSRHSIQYQV